MKTKTLVALAIILTIATTVEGGRRYNSRKIKTGERFSLSYDIQSLNMKSSKDLIHHLDGEVFFLPTTNKVNVGAFLEGHKGGVFVANNSEDQKYISFGPSLKFQSEKFETTLKAGYFLQKKEIFYKGDVIETNNLNGLDLGVNINLLQNDFKFVPKIELFVETKIEFSKKYFQFNNEDEGINEIKSIVTTSICNYQFGVNVHLYRINLGDYYMSPMIGLEKSESFTRKNLFQIKAGMSLNNGVTTSNIFQVGISLSFYNNGYYQTIEGESTISPCMFGVYMKINPSGFFIHRVK